MNARPSFCPKPDPNVQARFRGCFLGGAVGDALGAAVEFAPLSMIYREYGPQGIRDFAARYGAPGLVTDDTQMALFTAEGLLRSHMRASLHGYSHPPTQLSYAYLRWLYTQEISNPNQYNNLDGFLIDETALHAKRAPGETCLAALRNLETVGVLPSNDKKGCGGVMRVAPVGLLQAALKGHLTTTFDLGCMAAGITHGHPTGQLASGVFATVLQLLLQGRSLEAALSQVLLLLKEYPNHKETLDALLLAMDLADKQPQTTDAIIQIGKGWIAEEALAIGVYCALHAQNLEEGVILAVNHGGDSDSTGLIAGHLLGAQYGVATIPERWLNALELRTVLEEVADDLATVQQWPLADEQALAYYLQRYPDH